MTRHIRMIVLGLLIAVASLPVAAQEPEVKRENAEALKAEIKDRCNESMGEYGKSMVLSCMERDWSAVKRIPEYRQSHPDITDRCLRQMRRYGFAMVLSCIRRDVEAAQQIEDW